MSTPCRFALTSTLGLWILAASCASTRVTAPATEESLEDGGVALPDRGICAHRGASATHPENTVAALREAVRLGAHMIEIDLRLTRDRRVVLMHDATVDRTTDGRGRVADLTLPKIKRLDAGRHKDLRFEGEKVPTLGEALRVLPYNCWINLHLKGGAQLARTVTETLIEDDRLHQSVLACGPTAAAAARAIAPEVMICNVHRRRGAPDAYVRDSVELRSDFIQFAEPPERAMAWFWHAKQRGMRVNYCCTDDQRAVWRLFRSGVEFVLVDDVATMLSVVRRLGIAPLSPVFVEP